MTRLRIGEVAGLAAALAIVAFAGAAAAVEVAPTSCTLCHSNTEVFDQASVDMVKGYGNDIHASVGLSCHDCHGGNPDPKLAEDLDAAMSDDWKPNPFRGEWSPKQIPAACGRCHSDPDFMRKFRPDLRVDQETEYRTSHHGKALAAGDERVATCVSCHGVHDIRSTSDPAARTYPTRVAETCGRCHSDPERMKGTMRNGAQIPTNQRALWSVSVHAKALEAGDLSAPTCNDCHGNHGATPPGVESLAFVCGQCHVRESQVFQQSGKFAALQIHNEFLSGKDVTGCADCHQAPDPAVNVTGMHAFLQCAACHTHHAIVRPTIAMLAPLPEVPCAFCHEGPQPIEGGARPIDVATYVSRRDALIAAGKAQGLQGDDLFDWLVDRAQELETHVMPAAEAGQPPTLRPEFATLFRKLRIGKTHYDLKDPATGAVTHQSVVRCSKCHAAEPTLTTAEGLPFAAQYLELMRTAAFETARAERLVLRAKRGGLQVRAAQDEISHAVDAQISTQALLHTFSLDEGGELRKKFAAAEEHATKAGGLGQEALAELQTRRRGLAGSLVLVVIALIALAIKIRQLG